MTLLDVIDLHSQFETRTATIEAVRGVTFTVAAGQSVGIVGETGSGKSVTLRSILGLLRPPGRVTDGSAVFNGTDLIGLSPNALRSIRGKEIGFIPQNPFGSLNPILPIRTQFANVLKAHGQHTSGRDTRERAVGMLESVGINEAERVLDGHAHQLSGGMAQRTAIALAFILEPQLIVADEPTTALDVTVQKQILDLLAGLIAEGHRSLLIVTHDLGVVANYCEHVVVMYRGEVVEQGPVDSVFGAPTEDYTRTLLASIPKPGERW